MKPIILIASLFFTSLSFAQTSAYIMEQKVEGMTMSFLIVKDGDICTTIGAGMFGSEISKSDCSLDKNQFRMKDISAEFCDAKENEYQSIAVGMEEMVFDITEKTGNRYVLSSKETSEVGIEVTLKKISIASAKKMATEQGCKI